MAKGLKSLIRLSAWSVDEKRRALGAVQDELVTAEQMRDALEQEIQHEQLTAEQSPHEAGLYYGNYIHQCLQRRDQIAQNILDIQNRVSQAREELSEAYLEQKKYETVEKNRKEKEDREQDRKQQIVLDELGLQNHTRQQGN